MVNNKRHRNRAAKLHQTATVSGSSTPHRKQLHLFHQLRVRRVEIKWRRKRARSYRAYEKARPKVFHKRVGPYRLIIWPEDLVRLLGMHKRTAQRDLQLTITRLLLGKHRLAAVTIREWCACSEMPDNETHDFINNWEKARWERIKDRIDQENEESKEKKCPKSKKVKAIEKEKSREMKIFYKEMESGNINKYNDIDDEDDDIEYFDDSNFKLF